MEGEGGAVGGRVEEMGKVGLVMAAAGSEGVVAVGRGVGVVGFWEMGVEAEATGWERAEGSMARVEWGRERAVAGWATVVGG